MTNYTKGPWTWVRNSCTLINGDEDQVLAIDCEEFISDGDKALIAAAPELLDAVKRVLAGFEANAFQRNTDGDHDPAWAIKFMPHLMALAAAARAVEKAEGTK